MYKSLLSLNENSIFEIIPLMVVKIKSGTMKVVNNEIFSLQIHKYQIVQKNLQKYICIFKKKN